MVIAKLSKLAHEDDSNDILNPMDPLSQVDLKYTLMSLFSEQPLLNNFASIQGQATGYGMDISLHLRAAHMGPKLQVQTSITY